MRARRRPELMLAAVLLASGTRSGDAGTPAAGFVETTVVEGLSRPTAFAFLPDRRLLVTEHAGALRLVSNGVATTIATLPACFSEVAPIFQIETGLLGIAVHPAFPTDRSIYLFRTRTTASEPCTEDDIFGGSARNEVVRVTLDAGDTVDLGTLQPVLPDVGAETGYHNGGCLRIGPDQKLYVAIGDNAVLDPQGPPGSSTNPYAQSLSDVRGKILRLELDGSPAAGNPFVGQVGARAEVFAVGFRNPFRFGFDPVTGALWAGDVGQNTIEEIDLVTAGGNYGWPRCEGTLPDGCALPGDTAPVFEYPHEGAGALGVTVTAGGFPRAGALAAYDDRYFFGDFLVNGGGAIYAVPLDDARTAVAGPPETIVTNAGGVVDIVIGPDGALYYAAYLQGAIRRLAAEGTPPPPPPPSGCKTIATCQTALDATLPDPSAAVDAKSRKTARKLAKLDRKSDGKLAKASTATGSKQAKRYAQARRLLGKLLAAAQTADGKGRLGVALAPIEAAVAAVLAGIPAS